MSYDVVIVGASIADCTAATLYGRAGLRVALVEKHRSAATFKTLCGHFLLGGTQGTLRRTGLWEAMEREGAAVGIAAVHDRKLARAVYLFAMRAVPVSGLLNPG